MPVYAMQSSHQESCNSSPYLRAPLKVALVVTGIYFLIYESYILLSDAWVQRIATTPDRITELQTIKGLISGVLTSVLVFCIIFFLIRRIAAKQRALELQHQALITTERQAAASLLAHSLAHDINNVLTVGMTNVEMLQMQKTLDPQSEEMLADIGKSFERIHDMTRQLSRIGRSNHPQSLIEIDLAAVVQQEIRYIQAHRSARNVAIEYDGPGYARCRVNESAIRELLSNLLLNAAEATNGTGKIAVHLTIEGADAVVEVHDNGPGVPPDQRGHLFDPLYTTKENGLGLGLLSVKSAAKLHQGQVEINDSPLGGACFRVVLTHAANTQKNL